MTNHARFALATVVVVAAALAAAGCASAPAAAPPPAVASSPASPSSPSSSPASAAAPSARSLYERLGGKPAIEIVVGEFLGNVARDTRIQARFAFADLPDLKAKLVDQICAATGGPCVYGGRDMKVVHQGMRISDAELTALVEDLAAALDKCGVGGQEKTELLGALGAMRGAIVEVKGT